MPDTQSPEGTVTIASQSIELRLTGKPDVKNKWGAGSIRPRFVVFTYLPEGIRAHLYGVWVREDGELTDAPCDQDYRIGDTDEWPAWMTALAREHKPSGQAPSASRAAALREAADAITEVIEADRAYSPRRSNDRAALGGAREIVLNLIDKPCRVADETQQPEDEAPVAPEAPAACEGFQWIGQSFATCERCGQPAWEHAGEEVPVDGAGPFDTRRTVRPWAPGQADRIRAKWGTPALAAQQPKEA